MYSKNIDMSDLGFALDRYIRTHKMVIVDTQALDIIMENPDMQRLIMIWLKTNNELQISHLLTHTLRQWSHLSEEQQNNAVTLYLEHAQQLNAMIPAPSDLDMVLESMGEPTTLELEQDGWSNLCVPLFDLTDSDIKKLQIHAFFINHGVFSANLLLGMTLLETAAFNARVAQIIHDHSDFIYPSRIFSDKLIRLVKSDRVIQEILSEANAVSPPLISPQAQQAVADRDLVDLNELLGFDDASSTVSMQNVDAGDLEEPFSSLSPSTLTSDGEEDSEKTQVYEYRAAKELTERQRLNIQQYDLQGLIQIKELNPFDVPDHELTAREIALFRLMNKLMKDLKPQQQEQATQTYQEQGTRTYREQGTQTYQEQNARISDDYQEQDLYQPRVSSPASTDSYHYDNSARLSSNSFSPQTVAYEYPTPEPKRMQPKRDRRDGFIPVIRDDTHNRFLKERNLRQRKLDYLGNENPNSPMPSWHQQAQEYRAYKQRMREQQDTGVKEEKSEKKAKIRPRGTF